MVKKILGKIKLILIIFVILFCAYFFVLGPTIRFKGYEKKMEDAARRYFELNSNQLPTGERVKTLPLQTLYHSSYVEGDFYKPLSKKSCNITNSWVKVRRENGDYKYYAYLDCGSIHSSVDHEGPVIKLNGKDEITLGVNEKFKDEGISSVVDKVDGNIKIDDGVVKGNVDTSKIGTYEITYKAVDSLANETVVTRKVIVVKKLNSTVKSLLGDKKYFNENHENNFIRISNQVFRIIGLDGNNVRVVASEDVSNVNYSKLDKWLDFYYDNLNDFTKKAIVSTKYCNDVLAEDALNTTKCNSYTKKRNVYIPSVIDINLTGGDKSFMKLPTITWVANSKNNKEAYVFRNFFLGDDANKSFITYPINENYGVRPMMTLNGDILISDGDGTLLKPYSFGDTKVAVGGDDLNTRETGEYVKFSNFLWRILDVDSEGNTRVITVDSIAEGDLFTYTLKDNKGKIEYNPKNKSGLGYFINNATSKYIKPTYLVKHEVEVPIYKNEIIYGEVVKTEKYDVLYAAPNMYDLFSAQTFMYSQHNPSGYWLINNSQKKMRTGLISMVGVPINMDIMYSDRAGIRVVAYVKKDAVIVSGKGTAYKPYILK